MRAWTRRLAVPTLAVLTVGILAAGAAPAAGATQAAEVIRFDKQYNPDATEENGMPTWTGTVKDGTVEVRLVDAWESGPVQHLVVDFIVTGPISFTARLRGPFNHATERTTLNGVVTGGMFQGARVHEEGLRIDEATSRFVGTLRVMPGSAS